MHFVETTRCNHAFTSTLQGHSELNGVRVIKKYSNRRLYDTVKGRYITLSDLRGLILEGTPFRVLDKDNIDITRSSLLQVLVELEESPEAGSVLSRQFLEILIASNTAPGENKLSHYLEECVRHFAQNPCEESPSQDAEAASN
jgi:polyhydroxyalkanoate synthesis repressor PhaR